MHTTRERHNDPPTLTEMADRAPARELVLRPRMLLAGLGAAVGVAATVWVLLEAWQVLSWIVIAAFFAVALTPAVDALTRRGLPTGMAVTVVTALGLALVGLLAWAFIPPLVDQTDALIAAAPGAVDDLTRGEGPLGWLERDYDIVERTREALGNRTGEGMLGMASPALGVLRGVLTLMAATVSVFFLTIFMLLEGRRWVSGGLGLLPARTRPRWERILAGVTRTIRGYVLGNLAISVIAGLVSFVTLTLLGVPFAVPLSVAVAVLDLIPLVGATLGTILVGGVALGQGIAPAVIVVVVFVVYQQIENHLLQPVVYGRAVQLSPLLIAISILIATAIAGLVGALLAIPIAGSLQIIASEFVGNADDGTGDDHADGPAAIGSPRAAGHDEHPAARDG